MQDGSSCYKAGLVGSVLKAGLSKGLFVVEFNKHFLIQLWKKIKRPPQNYFYFSEFIFCVWVR